MLKGGKRGFTLIELSLAVGFIALLSLTITLIIQNTVATYRRGLTLNQINTTGMDLVDEMRTVIQSSPSRSATYDCAVVFKNTADIDHCEKDNARSFSTLTRRADVKLKDGTSINVPVYGAICTGSYSYIWNSGYYFGDNRQNDAGPLAGPASLKTDTGTISGFRLLKVRDERRGVCKQVFRDPNSYKYEGSSYSEPDDLQNNLSAEFNVANPPGKNFSDDSTDRDLVYFYPTALDPEDIEIVLEDKVTNPLAIYDFTITPPASSVALRSAFYSGSFILGTLQGGINIKKSGNFCQTPMDYENDFDYCSINKFNFAAQATGG